MDVDMVVRRTAVYVLTTLAISLMLGSVVYVAGLYAFGGEVISPGVVSMRVIIAVAAMAVIVMTAAPLKNFLQERTDRFFYGERYDMRAGLLDFGRTLSATTSLEPLLDALAGRLQQVLGVERIAIFIEDARAASGYRVARVVGLSNDIVVPPDFREMIRTRSAEDGIVRADGLDGARADHLAEVGRDDDLVREAGGARHAVADARARVLDEDGDALDAQDLLQPAHQRVQEGFERG